MHYPNTSHCSEIALFCLLEPYADLVGAYMAGAWMDDADLSGANLLQYVEIDGTPTTGTRRSVPLNS